MEAIANKDTEKFLEGKLHFKHLPAYAKFLLEEKLTDFIKEQIRLSKKIDLPLLKYFESLPDEQLVELSRESNTEFLHYVIANNLDAMIKKSMQQWEANEIPLITSDQIQAEDLTYTGYTRKEAFAFFLPQYTTDMQLALAILSEIEEYTLKSQTIAIKFFINMQHEKLDKLNTQLHKNENQLLEAQEIANMGSFEWDLVDHQSNFSPQFGKILGLEKSSDLETFLEYVHPDDKDKIRTAIDKAMSKQDLYEAEYRYHKDGTGKVIWSRGVVTFMDGKPHHMKGTIMDVTQRKIAEDRLMKYMNRLEAGEQQLTSLNQSLHQKNQELERSNQELTSFSYVASHDLQEPLRKIKTFTSLIADTEYDQLSDKGRQLFGKIHAAAGRMQQLIEDLLAFSRTNITTEEFEPVNLNAVLLETKYLYEETINNGQLILSYPQLPVVNGLLFQLQQLFNNIINNSIKYRKPDTILHIDIQSETVSGQHLEFSSADPQKNYYKISVKDNGIGFDDKYADKVFEIFQRLHHNSGYSGTGIGLAICKKIVQNHDGFITAESKEGEGSVFTVYLPE